MPPARSAGGQVLDVLSGTVTGAAKWAYNATAGVAGLINAPIDWTLRQVGIGFQFGTPKQLELNPYEQSASYGMDVVTLVDGLVLKGPKIAAAILSMYDRVKIAAFGGRVSEGTASAAGRIGETLPEGGSTPTVRGRGTPTGHPKYRYVWKNIRGNGVHDWELAERRGARVVKSGDDVIAAAMMDEHHVIVFVKMKSGELRVAPKYCGHDILSGGDGAEVLAAGEARVDVTRAGKGPYISDQSGSFFHEGENNSREAMEAVQEELHDFGIEFERYSPPE